MIELRPVLQPEEFGEDIAVRERRIIADMEMRQTKR